MQNSPNNKKSRLVNHFSYYNNKYTTQTNICQAQKSGKEKRNDKYYFGWI